MVHLKSPSLQGSFCSLNPVVQVLNIKQPWACAVAENTWNFTRLHEVPHLPWADGKIPGGLFSFQESGRDVAIAAHAPLVLRKKESK